MLMKKKMLFLHPTKESSVVFEYDGKKSKIENCINASKLIKNIIILREMTSLFSKW